MPRDQLIVEIPIAYNAWRTQEALKASAMPKREMVDDDTFDEQPGPKPSKKRKR